jgi:hypothetical protein
MFSAGLSRAQVAWLGPDNGDDILSDFLDFFKVSMKVDGGIFLVCTDEGVSVEERKMARARGHGFVTSGAKLEKHQILAPGQLVRLENYEKLYAETGMTDQSFFADLDQNVTGASTAGSMIPSLLTHGTMYALHAGRVVCPDELYVSHGYNVVPLPKNSAARSCRIKSFLKQMPTHQRLHLLGNAWHLPVVSAWCLYVLSHCVWVNRNMTVQPERSLLRKGGSRLCELDWDQSPEKNAKKRPTTTSSVGQEDTIPSSHAIQIADAGSIRSAFAPFGLVSVFDQAKPQACESLAEKVYALGGAVD